jgi:hypothetical protein
MVQIHARYNGTQKGQTWQSNLVVSLQWSRVISVFIVFSKRMLMALRPPGLEAGV